DLPRNAPAHYLGQRRRLFGADAVRKPAARPDIGDGIILIGTREADRGYSHRPDSCMTAMWPSVTLSNANVETEVRRQFALNKSKSRTSGQRNALQYRCGAPL